MHFTITRVIGICLGSLLSMVSGRAADWYVSPLGTPNGAGTLLNPWGLHTALNHSPQVQPGDCIWLRGGRYGNGGRTKFLSALAGAATQPILVRGYPGEPATVDSEISTLTEQPGTGHY